MSNVSPVGIFTGPCPREARREWPIALAREVAAQESTVTLALHPWRMGSGMGY